MANHQTSVLYVLYIYTMILMLYILSWDYQECYLALVLENKPLGVQDGYSCFLCVACDSE